MVRPTITPETRIERAIDIVCEYLPAGFEIVISLEADSGIIRLIRVSDDKQIEFELTEFTTEGLASDLESALRYAETHTGLLFGERP